MQSLVVLSSRSALFRHPARVGEYEDERVGHISDDTRNSVNQNTEGEQQWCRGRTEETLKFYESLIRTRSWGKPEGKTQRDESTTNDHTVDVIQGPSSSGAPSKPMDIAELACLYCGFFLY